MQFAHHLRRFPTQLPARRFRRSTAALTLALAISVAMPSSVVQDRALAAPRRVTAGEPRVEPIDRSAVPTTDPVVVDWARRRFEVAGLRAPDVRVHFVSAPDGCGQHFGRYLRHERLVEICISEHAPRRVLRQLVLHELAHAWANDTLDDVTRSSFVELSGATSWNDGDDDWHRRGTEHAAETVAWGLMDVAVEVHHDIGTPPAALRRAFMQLTGRTPINDGFHLSDDPTPFEAIPVPDRR